MLAVVVYGILSLSVCLLPPPNTRSLFTCRGRVLWFPRFSLGLGLALARAARHKREVGSSAGLASFPFFLLHAAPLTAISRRFQDQATVWVAYYLACWLVAIALTLLLAQAKNRLAGGWHRQKN